MKNTWRALSRVLIVGCLVILPLLPIHSVAQDQKPLPTEKELKVLLRTAKEPAEHRRIAEYYRQRAAKLNASSTDHLRAAAVYDYGPSYPAMPSKHWAIRFNHPANHCRAYAKSDAKKARKAESLALLHEQMAEAAEQRQP